MDQTPNYAPPLTPTDSKRWILRLTIALVLAAAVWNLIVSLTVSLILPLTARTMGGDPQSPLYLGKGDIDIPALFVSVLELCFAGIVAVILNSIIRKAPKQVRRTGTAVASIVPQATAPSPRPAPLPAQPTTMAQAPVPQAPAPRVAAPTQPPQAKPQPPKALAPQAPQPENPKKVMYNLVGDPIPNDED